MTMRAIWLMMALPALFVPCVLAPALDAATFTVTKETDDNGPCYVVDCALREAIIASNETPGLDTILIPGGRYVLSIPGGDELYSVTGDLNILGDIEIIGDLQFPVVLDGAGMDRVLAFYAGNSKISNVTIMGGSHSGPGAGLLIIDSSLTINNSLVSGNQAMSYDGGGISVWDGSLVLINSTVSNNYASRVGGGIERTAAAGVSNVTLINSTVSGNYASQGGGIFSDGRGDLTLINSTVAGNTAALSTTGIVIYWSDGPIMTNSIVVDRCGYYYGSAPRSKGGNIVTPDSYCYLDHPTDQQVELEDLLLGPLTYNGGPTMTHALLPGSPAIDAGVVYDCPKTDQRGRPRPIDGDGDGAAACDAGGNGRSPRAGAGPAGSPEGLAVRAVPTAPRGAGRFALQAP
ncbi:MAG: hypothetical protein GY835_28215, partial [bacterium]|nr:hypothetical protein [bacterium]